MRKRRMKEVPACQLKGSYQEKNQQTAFVALQVLRNICGVELSKEAIAKGFAEVCTLTGLRGRWEVLSCSPLTICDTGHNSHGIRYVAEQLSSLIASSPHRLSPHRLHIVFGMVNDKDIDTVLGLLPENAVYYFTQPATSRALPAEELCRRWHALHPIANPQYPIANRQSPISAFSTVREALAAAQRAASADDIIFIGGSNYVVGEVLRLYS